LIGAAVSRYFPAMSQHVASVGTLVRSWRQQRHLSQLGLATDAEISQKHLSFIESGRAAPSRDMVLHLADHLEVPLRERNTLLMAAGFAPIFHDRPLTDPALARARDTIDRILRAHEPYPALSVDRHWRMISANAAVAPLLDGVDAELLRPPVNVMRLSLHPRGLAPLIVNLAEWRAHLLDRLRRQLRLTRDPVINALLKELTGYCEPAANHLEHVAANAQDEIAVPLRIGTPAGVLSLISTITVFGTPTEVALSELSMEAFYPMDDATADRLRELAAVREPKSAAGQ
jgi:transcriptional regulator with XRE-family HTH domain